MHQVQNNNVVRLGLFAFGLFAELGVSNGGMIGGASLKYVPVSDSGEQLIVASAVHSIDEFVIWTSRERYRFAGYHSSGVICPFTYPIASSGIHRILPKSVQPLKRFIEGIRVEYKKTSYNSVDFSMPLAGEDHWRSFVNYFIVRYQGAGLPSKQP